MYKIVSYKKILSTLIKFILFFSFSNILIVNKILSEEELNFPSSNYIDNLPTNEYLLGKGDKLRITISKDEFFKDLITDQKIDINGVISVPKLNRVYVNGLTVGELQNILNERYKEFINYPDVSIQIIEYRNISFYIKGEVNNPGFYTFDSEENLEKKRINNQILNFINPTVFDAIRISGGITPKASIKNITLTRKNSITNGGGKIQTNLNFSNLFLEGDLSQNIGLRDGDIIKIPKSEIINNNNITKAIKTNLNSKTIKVVVSGKVEEPGKKVISISSSLNDVILVAGGTKPLAGKILLIKFKNDGKVKKLKLKYSPNAKAGSLRNPLLNDGDLVFVGKGAISHVTSILNQITSPLSPVVTSYGLYKALTD